ncbi:rhodoquinone biosynthesis methyltransferase RquA [Rhizobium halophytocola]|uniref:SAM-dependent methyltransferase n=1 Tax=Rhizobium halophytocola TaxID=735519 RepID=A0ABS4DVQ5_9HYPH|nr:rhodoquinone biosynthesis methyltransferase RquA [Rhizobium halophytocola]MBP1849788.1 SAM-dependent methyltransferase [Rhizobium halophytocola]
MTDIHHHHGGGATRARAAAPRGIPAYLERVYHWAYLSPRWARILDHHLVVQAILWGNADRLMADAVAEFSPGDVVLQPASVYGNFSERLLARLGLKGRLDLRDVAPLQIARSRAKLKGRGNVDIRLADAAVPPRDDYDGICCFFLLHEVPGFYKRRIVNSLLGAVRPGGKVVIVDYHRMAKLHPLRPVMAAVFGLLEPFASELTGLEIADLADTVEGFEISKRTYFGGLYQKVVFRRKLRGGEDAGPVAGTNMTAGHRAVELVA